MSPHDRLAHAVSVIRVLVLHQNTHALVFVDGHVALVGFELAAQNTQKGGFARAVGADDAVAIPLGEFHIHVFEQHAAAELQCYVVYADHA